MTEQKKAGIEIDEDEYQILKDQYEFNNERKEILRNFIKELKGDICDDLYIYSESIVVIKMEKIF